MVKNFQIVVIGASGFVAKNLRKYLSTQNVRLISISRNNFNHFENEQKIISKNYDGKNLASKLKNSDAIVHLVGIGRQSPELDYNVVNVEFTRKIVNLAKKAKIKKIIFNSGLGVSPNTPLGYFISKYKAERIIIGSGLNYVIFRPSYIVGRNDQLTKYLKKQIKNKKIEIPGTGSYSIQPIYINDVTKILFQSVIKSNFDNKIIDLVGSEYISFEKYVKLFSKGTHTSIKKISLERAYHNAIANPKLPFGVDDLNILVGNFKGNHNKLQKITKMKFHSITELLKSGRLF